MKTKILRLLSGVVFFFPVWCQAAPAQSSVQTGDYSCVQRNPDSKVWQRTLVRTNHLGTWTTNVQSYTELATGLCYLKDGQYVDSVEQIDPVADGAQAVQGRHTVHWMGNINTPGGSVDLKTSDGKELLSTVYGLAYEDTSTGSNVMLAFLQDSFGQIVSNNTVVYTNAFSNLTVDVRYTYRKAGLSQDIILQQNPPSPSEYGLNPTTTRLQAITQFFNAPTPTVTTFTTNGLSDNRLIGFGEMKLGVGRAFLLPESKNSVKPKVIKHWVTNDMGTFLIEEVPYASVSNLLSNLHSSNIKPDKSRVKRTAKLGSPDIKRHAPTHAHPLSRRAALSQKRAVVLDYELVTWSTGSYTFQGDTTYLVSGDYYSFGTTIIEGGTVVKYTNNPSAEEEVNCFRIECETAPYRPAVFTSMNDDSVGQPISGSTGDPSGDYCGGVALNIEAGGSRPPPVVLSNLRFNHFATAIELWDLVGDGQFDFYLNDFQILNCQTVLYQDPGEFNITLNNGLIYNVQSEVFDAPYWIILGVPSFGWSLNGANVTMHNCADFTPTNLVVINFANSLIVGVTNYESESFNDTSYFYNTIILDTDPGGVFQTVGAACHYLAPNSYQGQGTTSIDPDVLADVEGKTTYPPNTNFYGWLTNDYTFWPQAQRDNSGSAVDLGYHYDPIDYALALSVSNANLTITPGTVLAGMGYAFNDAFAIWMAADVNLVSSGTAVDPNVITRYNTVQEQSTTNWESSSWQADVLMDPVDGNTNLSASFRFTDWSVLSGEGLYENSGGSDLPALNFRDCELHDGTFEQFPQTIVTTNCLFDRVQLQLSDPTHGTCAISNVFCNDLFYYGSIQFNHDTNRDNSVWTFQNNVFDWTVITTTNLSANDIISNNAYIFGASQIGTNSSNVIISNHIGGLIFESGPLGDFYYTATNATNLIFKGSQLASSAGLYHYTVTTNNVIDGTNMVSIGFHYVATDAYGVPLDSNGDGIPDYLEDANGNGLDDPGETPWNLAILTQPTNQGVPLGGCATFNVLADGIGPVLYQWRENGTNINGATNALLTFCDINASNAGTYSVVVSNASASIQSSNATLSLLPGSFLFSNFCDVSSLQINHNALQTNTSDGCVLELTTPNGSENGSAFIKEPILFSNTTSFTTFFSFRLSHAGPDSTNVCCPDPPPDILGADGIMFVLQTTASTDYGWGGGFLGYGHDPSDTNNYFPNSLGIEFDTYGNESPNNYDPILPGTTNVADGNHVGIDTNGSVISMVTDHVTDYMNNSNIWYAWINYDGSSTVLTLRLSETNDETTAPVMLSTAVNLESYLRSTNVYVGFTAGTGTYYNQQDILSWQFSTSTSSNSYSISIISPTNGSTVNQGTNTSVEADAAVPAGTSNYIVNFFDGTNFVGASGYQTNLGLYDVPWVPIGGGIHNLTAVLLTNSTVLATSAVVQVNARYLPVISITYPTTNFQSFLEVTNVTITATASETNGVITNIQFFAYYPSSSNSIGNFSTSGGSVTTDTIWSNLGAGSYPVVAAASDDGGVRTISAIRVFTVTPTNPPPFVEITYPTNGAVFVPGCDLTITAIASNYSNGGSITNVEFFANSTDLGGSSNNVSNIYSITECCWKPGVYTLTAVASDSFGMTSVATNQITIAPDSPSVQGFWDSQFSWVLYNYTLNYMNPIQDGPVSGLAHGTNGTLFFVNGENLVDYTTNGTNWTVMTNTLNYTWPIIATIGTNLYTVTELPGNDLANLCVWNWTDNDLQGLGTNGLVRDGEILALAQIGNQIYAAGDFTGAGTPGSIDTSVQYIARFDETSNAWVRVGNGIGVKAGDIYPIRAIACIGNDLYIGGSFTNAGGNSNANYIARLDGNVWTNVGAGISFSPSNHARYPVDTLAVCGTNLFVGGEFDIAGGITNAHGVAIWNTAQWQTLNGGPGNSFEYLPEVPRDCADYDVFTITPRGNRIFLGGDFTNVFNGTNSVAANNVAMATWSDSQNEWIWSGMDYGTMMDGYTQLADVYGSLLINGPSPDAYDVYIYGDFSTIGSAQIDTVDFARWRVGYPPPPSAPTVAITSPSSPSIYTNPVSITLSGLAASSYTALDTVNLFANGASIASDSGSTNALAFTNVWNPASSGLYLITATAIDASNLMGSSGPIVVNIKSISNSVVARDDQYTIPVGTLSTNLQVLANDSPSTGLKISQVTLLHNDLGIVSISFDRTYLTYTPFPNVYGTNIFFYTVTNSSGSNDSASVTLNLLAAPQVSITNPVDGSALPTSTLAITGTSSAVGSGNAITNITFFGYSSNSVAILSQVPTNGVFGFTWTNTQAGWYTFVASATDVNGSSAVSAPVTISLTNGSGLSDAITATIANLTPSSVNGGDASVQNDPVVSTGIFDLQGQASDSDTNSAVSYKVLLYQPSTGISSIGDPDENDVAGYYASTPPFADLMPGPTNYLGFHIGGDTNGDLGILNFSGIPNGVYELVLQVRGGTGVTNTIAEFLLNSQLKIGQFSFSEQDVILPVSGIPLTITRTYNSMNPVNADFGYNWTFAINSLNVQLDEQRQNVEAGSIQDPNGPTESDGSGLPPTISVRTGGGWDVNITLPNGQTAQFQANFYQGDYGYMQPSWSAPGITRYTLTDPNGDYYEGLLGLTAGGWNNQPGFAFENFDIPSYLLTDNTTGVQYNITRGAGRVISFDPDNDGNYVYAQVYGPPVLTSIVQPSGDTIRITTNAIVNYPPPLNNTSSSRSVTFARDGSGRIIAVYDPNSTNSGIPAVQYVYNQTTSNLIQVLKLVNSAAGTYTTNFYDYNNPNFPHYITSIENGDGVTVARNFYDSSGKLIEVEDANGNFTQFIHNLTNNNEIVIDQLGHSTSYSYDGNGNVLAKTNALGQITTMGCDANNNQTNTITYLGSQPYATNGSVFDQTLNLPLTTTDPLGNTTAFSYFSYGNLNTTTDARSNTASNYYDSSWNLIGTSDALGNTTSNTYAGGMLVTSTDALGNTTSNVYDGSQNLLGTATFDMSGNILSSNSLTYDLNGNRLTSTVWRHSGGSWVGATTTGVYDSQNRVVQTVNPDGGTNTTVYDGAGHQVQTIDALGNPTSYGYDYMGRLVQTTYPDGTTESSAYDATGNRTNSTDRLGRVTSYFYDALNRLTNTVYADGASNVTVYDGVGRVSETIGARGTVTAYGYDVAGRRIAVTNAYGTSLAMVSLYAYDADGNQTNFTDPLQRVTTNVFDALNRQFETLYPDGTQTGMAYDGDGRKVAQTNQDNIVTSFGYDGAGRLTSVTDALTNATHYQYDEAGNEIYQIDALNRTNTYAYDGLARRIGHLLPGVQAEEMAYDLNGNLTFMTNCSGVVITNQYDALNRLTNKMSASGYQIQFAYSATGQRTNMVDPSGTTAYAYDVRDRLTNKVTTWNGGFDIVLNYGYDANGNVTNLASSTVNGASLIYGYDSLNRLTNASAYGGLSAAYGYDGAGNLEETSYGNGVTNLYQYDTLNRLTNAVWNYGGSPLAGFAYQLGLTGSRTNLSETVNSTARNYGWQYDRTYRLTNETISTGGGAGYGLDAVGNRLTRSGANSQSLAYNTNDWLTTDAYDANGNTLESTNSGITTGPFSYDAENHLTNAAGVLIVYNGDGLRVAEVVSGVTNYYLLDDRNPTGYPQVVELWTGFTGSAPAFTAAYNYGLSIYSQRAPTMGGKNYFIPDGHGSTRMLIGNTGTINNVFAYDSYGNLIASNAPSQTPYLYCAYPWDSGAGMYYNLARFLQPNTGRFWTADTFQGNQEDPPSLHKYFYCEVDPVNSADPSGFITINPSILRFLSTFGSVDLAIRTLVGIRATYVLGDAYRDEVNNSPNVFVNQQIGRLEDPDLPGGKFKPDFVGKPDILDLDENRIYEVKPNNAVMIALGKLQLNGYLKALRKRYPGRIILPGDWNPKKGSYSIVSLPGISDLGIGISITAENKGGGVIAYDIYPNPEIISAVVSIGIKVATTSTADNIGATTQTALASLIDLLAF